MNREIKFRAKSIYKESNWVYGELRTNEKSNISRICDHFGNEILTERSTVGQYTGLKDANGKEVYEGDILESKYKNAIFVVTYNEKNAAFGLENQELKKYQYLDSWMSINETWWRDFTPRIIGNIHDNPKLLTIKEGK